MSKGELSKLAVSPSIAQKRIGGQMLLPYPQFFFRRRVNYVQGGKPEPGKEKPGSTKGSILTYLPPQGMSYGEALNKLLSVMESKGFNGWAK